MGYKHVEAILNFTEVFLVFLGYPLMFNQSGLEINRSSQENHMKKT